jgi:hypothetical protein
MANNRIYSTIAIWVSGCCSNSLFVLSIFLFTLFLSTIATVGAEASITLNRNIPQASDFCNSVSEIPHDECEALVALYYSTNGPDWGTSTNWMETNTPCSWQGVTCRSGNVSILNLGGFGLSGPLPDELGNLSKLEELRLDENFDIEGPIPATIGNLSQLRVLDLFKNKISGPIPAELGKLANLTHLYLSTNRLSGPIPEQLGNLSSLTVLDLSGNRLEGPIPTTLGNLHLLTRLNFNYNRLSGPIPYTFCNLSKLTGFSAAMNQLDGHIPSTIGNLTNLTWFELGYNLLSGPIPYSITQLTDLEYLNLNNNALHNNYPEIAAFVEALNPFWETTQTVAPGDFRVRVTNPTEVALDWSPISYQSDPGHYEVSYADNLSGPYSLAEATPDKADSGTSVSGLMAGKTYFFRVRTYTSTVWLDRSNVWSEYSPSLEITTPLALQEVSQMGAEFSFDLQGGGRVASISRLVRSKRISSCEPCPIQLSLCLRDYACLDLPSSWMHCQAVLYKMAIHLPVQSPCALIIRTGRSPIWSKAR